MLMASPKTLQLDVDVGVEPDFDFGADEYRGFFNLQRRGFEVRQGIIAEQVPELQGHDQVEHRTGLVHGRGRELQRLLVTDSFRCFAQ